ncbi:type II toxin-antitoxin system HicB family antitoxin [Thioalkalivibrio sp. ALE14]|uniref:type II toxin-antitoxin system HicB family antitoxin n=1 Tax=Thioalkalivibrio sp. ALE14 TaxID=1158168 RepID=UPI000372C75A|nr:type II toxin-antitoxin system HicB family antitoxin [Thioalkalivibrio sp. ALE14]
MNAQHYPVRIERDAAGRYLATCRDVPEALTDGAERDEAKTEMADTLMVALEGYRLDGRRLPPASRPEPGEVLIRVKAD